MFACVYLLESTKEYDQIYTYLADDVLAQGLSVRRGTFVRVPFGQGNSSKEAIVWRVSEGDPEPIYNARGARIPFKQISEVCSTSPLSDREMEFVDQIKHLYASELGDIIKSVRPLREDKEYKEPKPKAAKSSKKSKNTSQLDNIENTESTFENINKTSETTMPTYAEHVLNDEQQAAFDIISRALDESELLPEERTFLLHGITGSGKTEIYMHLIKKVIARGGNVIMLVPEIALTPSLVANYVERFGDEVAVYHSRLTPHKRAETWHRVSNGTAHIVVGTRSAVFVPFAKTDLIILDEEHDHSYRSEDIGLRYKAGEIAELRGDTEGAVVVYGSATPSMETYARATAASGTSLRKISYLRLSNRAGAGALPTVETVSMRGQGRQIFSEWLKNEMKRNYEEGHQTMIFVPRRGFASSVTCTDCGSPIMCGSCGIPMTYHAKAGRFICHYCGRTRISDGVCPKCGSKYLDYGSAGSERVEEEIRRMFPGAETLRADADTTAGTNGHEKIFKKFVRDHVPFLVGTQMIAKGHDFPDVTLVGILSADTLLSHSDFRAGENAFQILTQMSGRAGRSENAGHVIIQAYDTENYAITTAMNADYESFWNNERIVRSTLGYPPYSAMATLHANGRDDRAVYDYFTNTCEVLRKHLPKEISVLGPARDQMAKVNERYRWRITLKAKTRDELVAAISAWNTLILSGALEHIKDIRTSCTFE